MTWIYNRLLIALQEGSPRQFRLDSVSSDEKSSSPGEPSQVSSTGSPSELSESEELLADKYADLAENTIRRARQMGRKGIAALICEPFLVVPGLHILPQNYFERLYATVRENGGVFIADENQTGLGRIGTHNWAFQKTGIIPDIVTTGTSIGNGHPMVCSNQ